jgi:thioredoxin 1
MQHTKVLGCFLFVLLTLTACELPVGQGEKVPTLFVLPTLEAAYLPTPTPTPTATPSLTPTPPPPTWTPRPSLTPLPLLPALTRTRRPTLTPFIPPTYTPSREPVYHESDMPQAEIPALPTTIPEQVPLPTVPPTIGPTSTVWVPPLEISDATFQFEVLTYPLAPVLVEYYAPWCGYCQAMAPTVETLASEYYGHLKVVKINVDENPVNFQGYGLEGIPSFLIFNHGAEIARQVGSSPLEDMRRWIDGVIGW